MLRSELSRSNWTTSLRPYLQANINEAHPSSLDSFHFSNSAKVVKNANLASFDGILWKGVQKLSFRKSSKVHWLVGFSDEIETSFWRIENWTIYSPSMVETCTKVITISTGDPTIHILW